MRRVMMKSKIHRATVTQADLEYEGSISVDPLLLRAANIVNFEQVQIYDITNGSRLTTYAIPDIEGSGAICINGAAARLVNPGDMVIIVTYADYDEAELANHIPKVVLVDAKNRIAKPADAHAKPKVAQSQFVSPHCG